MSANKFTLVTYDCLHFKIVHTGAHGNYVEDSSPGALWKGPVSSHKHFKHNCRRPGCRFLRPEEYISRIKDANEDIHSYFEMSVDEYLEYGRRYHAISPKVRADRRMAGLGLLHQQYSIETRHWERDPFFDDWYHSVWRIICVEGIETYRLGLGEYVYMVNECRAIMGKVERDLKQLERELTVLEQNLWIEDEEEGEEEGGEEQEGEEEQEPKDCSNHAFHPMELFANVVREKWEKRVNGLREAFAF